MNSFIETIKVLDGRVYNILYHQERYESVLNSFGFLKYENLIDYINPPQLGLYRCRVIYTDEKISVTYHEYKRKEIVSLKLLYNDEIDYRYKSKDREKIDALYVKREKCSDILIVKNSYITDTSIANIALYKNGIWVTPKNPLLKGTTRARLIKEEKIVEEDISVKDIFEYSKIALLNAMIDFDIIQQKNIRDIIC